MESLVALFHQLSDLPGLIKAVGYVGLTAIIFTETGLLVGFFLPGDSLLVTAGLLASQGYLNVWVMGLLLSVAAVVGDTVGYGIGKAAGPRLFTRQDSLLFRKAHLERAHAFYEKHGGKTIVIARFMPIIRTFAPVVAGVGAMHYQRFLMFNVVGALAWVWSMLMIGYVLGRYIPGIDKHIDKVIIAVIFLSILPGIIGWLRERKGAVQA
jgi:membrane-associated protein